jgi:hypothetical protein
VAVSDFSGLVVQYSLYIRVEFLLVMFDCICAYISLS